MKNTIFLLIILAPFHSLGETDLEEELFETYCLDIPSVMPHNFSLTYMESSKRMHVHVRFRMNGVEYKSLSVMFNDFPDVEKGQPTKYRESDTYRLQATVGEPSYVLVDQDYHKIFTVRGEKVYQFVGFNQVFLGCPQPYCFMGGFDGIMWYKHAIHIFRGKHFWIKNSLKWFIRVGQAKPSVPDFGVDFIDAAIEHDQHGYLLFKVLNKDIVHIGSSRTDKIIEYFRIDFHTEYIDAACSFGNRTYLFKGDKYWSFSNTDRSAGGTQDVRTLNDRFPLNIDAAAVLQHKLFILKGYYAWVYETNSDIYDLTDLPDKVLIFQTLFTCKDELYEKAGFLNYSMFEQAIEKVQVMHDKLVLLQRVTNATQTTDVPKSLTLWYVLLIFGIIAASCVVCGLTALNLCLLIRIRRNRVKLTTKPKNPQVKPAEWQRPLSVKDSVRLNPDAFDRKSLRMTSRPSPPESEPIYKTKSYLDPIEEHLLGVGQPIRFRTMSKEGSLHTRCSETDIYNNVDILTEANSQVDHEMQIK